MINFDRLIDEKENLTAQEIINIGLFYYDFDADNFDIKDTIYSLSNGKKAREKFMHCKLHPDADVGDLEMFRHDEGGRDFDQHVFKVLELSIWEIGKELGLYKKCHLDLSENIKPYSEKYLHLLMMEYDFHDDPKWVEDFEVFEKLGTKTLYNILCKLKSGYD